ncbi:aluminum-activated malate transporter 2-like [Arachis duranensis]|uniref:Aluminum-activated malate transporter 2-like n=1 Tax=Arachis duranensis TaxID=130453 RepID=A0A6P4B493_ARADU|nr:aluminum-activated malate transporter 2-like [Arachis duranensis]XP_052112398.1 aluminum-activated malate transporter 2-like [Arachis duranensis]
MASPITSQENATCQWLRELPKKIKKSGQDDPRRITHSLKVGFALTLVSMFFYVQALYDSFGVNTLWAIMTVVVVMEFSVGATLGKGLNRMAATLLGGFLGFGVQQLATLPGKTNQPILLAIFLFIIGAVMTYIRCIPGVKAKYDYGFSIFILTFSLVSISGYRNDESETLELSCKRLFTIIIGSILSMIVSACIFPVWIGEDLHNSVAKNIEKIGDFLEGFINDSFNVMEEKKSKNEKSFAEEYESVLNSKTKEENMANLASWEPRHGKFQFNHPWKQYLKVGNSTRQCAYKMEALDCHIKSKIQITHELRNKIKDTCQHICLESGKALKELSLSIKSMKCLSKTNYKAHIANAKEAIESLSTMLKSNLSGGGVEVNLLEVVAIAAMASLLMDVVISIERISEQVDELASLAHFKSHNNVHQDETKATRTRPLPLLREGIMKRFFPRDKMPHHHNNRIHESSICSPKQNRSSTIEVIVQ